MANKTTAQRSLDDALEKESKRAADKAAARATGTDRLFRFGLKQGNTAEVIVLDESLDDGCHFHEHNVKGPEGYYNVYEQCPKEFYNCPLCDKFGESAFVLYLSVLHLDAWKDKQSGEWRNGRCLLGIKYSQLPTFKKVLKMAEKEHGTLRGVVLNLERPTGRVQDSPRIGVPVEFEDGPAEGKRYDFLDDLEEEYGHDAIMGQDGKTPIKAEDLDITPFDYETIFPGAFDMDAQVEDLRARYQGEPTPGSESADGGAWTDDETPVQPKRTRSRRRSSDDDGDELDMSPPKKRTRRKANAESEEAEPAAVEAGDGESEEGWA